MKRLDPPLNLAAADLRAVIDIVRGQLRRDDFRQYRRSR
jgi:hypothetical protein